MASTTGLKKQLHELIESASDEQVLEAVHDLLTQPKSAAQKKRTVTKAAFQLEKMTLPNGKVIFVTPGNPEVETTELFGIWKNHPITAEELRKKAWGNRA